MKLPFKISHREKKVILIGGIIVIVIILYNIGTWYSATMSSARDFIEARRLKLEKQLQNISEKKQIQETFDVLEKDVQNLEKGLLSGSKPPVVAAQIQRAPERKQAPCRGSADTERSEEHGIFYRGRNNT